MTASPSRWLLLAHQLPTRSSNARVKTWRRLQQIGAVPTRNSVYVLPHTDQCREDFEWIRAEIVDLGGEATVFAADALNAAGDADIVSAFQRAREADYRALKHDVDRAATRRRSGSSHRDAANRAIRTFQQRLNDIRRVDFFNAPTGQAAADAVAALERTIDRAAAGTTEGDVRLAVKDFAGRRWVTRPRPGVDRMASAWLIRRFIDPGATFGFAQHPAAGEIPFDMYTGEFSHQGTRCSFETLALKFDIADRSVARIGQIVHDLDMNEVRYHAPETPAVGRLVEGLRTIHPDDASLLEQGMAIFEALARSFASPAPDPSRRRGRESARTGGRKRGR
jgi:hypothetical protein